MYAAMYAAPRIVLVQLSQKKFVCYYNGYKIVKIVSPKFPFVAKILLVDNKGNKEAYDIQAIFGVGGSNADRFCVHELSDSLHLI